MSHETDLRAKTSKETSAAFAIWGTWLLIVLVLALLAPLTQGLPALVSEVAVLLHMTISLLIIGRIYPKTAAFMLAGSLVLRTGLVFWDLNFREALTLPGSGGDSEMFYYWSVRVARDPSLISAEIEGGAFSKMFGLLFYLIGPMRAFAQYTNAIFGLTVVMIIYRILEELQTSPRASSRTLAVAALLPNALVLSAVFLRESVIALLIAISIFYFLRWFLHGGPLNLLAAVAFVLAASVFHSGVIAIIVGYMSVALFYRRNAAQFGFSPQTIPYLILFAAIVALIITRYPDIFLGKFESFETEEELLVATNRRGGESTYLTGLMIENYRDLVLYGPLRALYFIASPLPWDWRGFSDAFTFFLDSTFYVGTLIAFFAQYNKLRKTKALGLALVVIIAISVFVFGAGVSNAGTALRHRSKLLPIFLVMTGIVLNLRGARDRNSIVSGLSIDTPKRSKVSVLRARKESS